MASQRQIIHGVDSTVLLRDDVLSVMSKVAETLLDQAIFASIARSPAHDFASACVDHSLGDDSKLRLAFSLRRAMRSAALDNGFVFRTLIFCPPIIGALRQELNPLLDAHVNLKGTNTPR